MLITSNNGQNTSKTQGLFQWLYLTEAYVEGKTDVLDEEDIHILLESDRDFRVRNKTYCFRF